MSVCLVESVGFATQRNYLEATRRALGRAHTTAAGYTQTVGYPVRHLPEPCISLEAIRFDIRLVEAEWQVREEVFGPAVARVVVGHAGQPLPGTVAPVRET